MNEGKKKNRWAVDWQSSGLIKILCPVTTPHGTVSSELLWIDDWHLVVLQLYVCVCVFGCVLIHVDPVCATVLVCVFMRMCVCV